MESILTTFHVDWRLMLAQLVNFAIVWLVLWQFALKPLIAKMTERADRIAQGLSNADEAEKLQQSAQAEREEILREARRQAQEIVETARLQAETKQQEALDKTKSEVLKVVQEGKVLLAKDREQLFADLKTEVSQLVMIGLKSILGTEISKSIDKKVVDQAVKDL